MSTRMNCFYAAAFAMALSLAPGRAHAQATCVDINTPAGIAVTAINQQLAQIAQKIQSLGPVLSQGGIPTLAQIQFVASTLASIVTDLQLLNQAVQGMANELGPVVATQISNRVLATAAQLNATISLLQFVLSGGVGGVLNPLAGVSEYLNSSFQFIQAAVPTICT
ncbi:hypothetical protein LXT21_40020 [Myxococcus sp. K38C18041901]|uniref:hypothetical protein n=1 Tax=Myxococcus guangdongensis TaxID=2906760 RepID=UPI0020A79729|nr:hypothetical protein [Myxococcus guangdongensis]MCP3064979.1 hypothetical protein [Myxococcus guangdongensis]